MCSFTDQSHAPHILVRCEVEDIAPTTVADAFRSIIWKLSVEIMKWPLRGWSPSLPPIDGPGDFGYGRAFYRHPGIDLYCPVGQLVQAMEHGVVVLVDHFTGPGSIPTSPWWNDTWSVMIEGASGVLGYCELESFVRVGDEVKEGQFLGRVLPVLKRDKGNGTSMLHFEQYVTGIREHAVWENNPTRENGVLIPSDTPTGLVNPRPLLQRVMSNLEKIESSPAYVRT